MGQQADLKGRDKSLRTQRLIDTAIGVSHTKGYQVATRDRLARVSALTRAVLYRYVASGAELLSTICIQAIKSFPTNTYDIGERDLTQPEELLPLIRDHISRIITSNRAMSAVFFQNEMPPAVLIREELTKRIHFAYQPGLRLSGRAVQRKRWRTNADRNNCGQSRER